MHNIDPAATELLEKRLKTQIKTNFGLAPLTTYKIGGPAQYFYTARDSRQLVTAIETAIEMKIPYVILGGGSNILVSDTGVEGLVIHNMTRNIKLRHIVGTYRLTEKTKKFYVSVDAGVLMNQLVRFCNNQGLAGLEMHLGLPGTVGGAIYINAKWTNPEGYVGDRLYQATIIDKNGATKTVPQSYFKFGYDYSILQKTGETVLEAVFELINTDSEKLWQISNESIMYRAKSQPQGIKSAGCIFRNITKAEALSHSTPNLSVSAGLLIDKAGLKGAKIGQAAISDQHANFIINTGNATARDINQLIELARDKVRQRFGIELKEEIIKVGEF